MLLCAALTGTAVSPAASQEQDEKPVAKRTATRRVMQRNIQNAIKALSAKYPADAARIETGVKQVSQMWKTTDGNAAEFEDFCSANFYTGDDLRTLFNRFEEKFEQINGHFTGLELALRRETDENLGKLYPFDESFASYAPSAHFTEDMFKNKLAFTVLLNFPQSTLEELLAKGSSMSREDWAKARLAQKFAHRVPPEVYQQITKAYAQADSYINQYNIYLERVIDEKGNPMFRKGLKLIAHWGLRDEIKAMYANPSANLERQKTIYKIMERIINQEIPASVINNPEPTWEPVANTVGKGGQDREPDTRYATLLAVYRANKLEDPYYKDAPTHMDRRFKIDREIPEADVQAMFDEVLTVPVGGEIAGLIKKQLGRDLMPFDIWYNGFAGRGDLSEEKLDKITAKKFPNLEAFAEEIPDILKELGFDKKTAAFLAEHIEVDAARGAGHAFGPGMKGQKAHLRTRVPQGGMDYQGFNTAMHELGHCVEQVFSMYRIDHTLLEGVPNTAFTEGFAFVFQGKDLEILGVKKSGKKQKAMNVLNDYWALREIAGVGLVDMRVWHWMYDNPKATPAQLREATVEIAKDVWNKYYAPVFGVKDSPILAIYSHMINSGLYLPDYPLGHIIAYQVEAYFEKHPLAENMQRMCVQGAITPAEWMQQAVGAPISPKPFAAAAEEAVKTLQK